MTDWRIGDIYGELGSYFAVIDSGNPYITLMNDQYQQFEEQLVQKLGASSCDSKYWCTKTYNCTKAIEILGDSLDLSFRIDYADYTITPAGYLRDNDDSSDDEDDTVCYSQVSNYT